MECRCPQETYQNVRPDALGVAVGAENVDSVDDADDSSEHRGGKYAREQSAS